MKRIAIELFAGCGGLSTGLEKAGFKVISAVEINPVAARSYELNHPNVKLHITDVSSIHAKDFRNDIGEDAEVDLLAGCSPCQGFSRLRKGEDALKDPRNQLVLQYLRLVKELKPKTILMENVPGLIKSEQGKEIFQKVQRRLKRLGYTVSFRIVDAADYGVPQFRKRFVLLGTRIGKSEIGIPDPVYGDPKKNDKKENELQPWKTVRQTIGLLPALKNGEKSEKYPLHRCSKNREKNLKRIKAIPHDGGSRMELPPELVLECHKRYPNGYKDVYGRMSWDKPSPTITGGCTNITRGRFIHPEQDRGISLLEAAMLQTFDPNYQFSGNSEQIALQIGNAVPVKLGETMGRRLIKYLDDAEQMTI